jgi:diguanylate cyclase (GGDEF)-like protein
VALVQRYGPEGALLLLDLDHFKAVNDTAGHHAGDRILETVADILRTSLRASDVVGRLGGDEFAVMLPKADETEARIVAAKIGDRIRKQCAGISGSAGPPVTASIGVVVLDPLHATADQALMAADRAMYDAKASGRDGFAVAAPVGGAAPRGS